MGRQKAVDLEDIKFHQCVRLASFERDRTISFIPPDGAFDLMTYRLSQNVKPLIWVDCQVERHSRSRIEYLVKARSQFKERSAASSVEIMLPLPADAISPTVRTSQGKAEYVPEKSALVWTIKNFPGGREFLLRTKFGLPSVEAEDEGRGRMPPIKVKFEVSELVCVQTGQRSIASVPAPPFTPASHPRSPTSPSAASRCGTLRSLSAAATRRFPGSGVQAALLPVARLLVP